MRVLSLSISVLLAGFAVQPAVAADNFQSLYVGVLGAYEDYGSDLTINGQTVLSDSASGPAGGLFVGGSIFDGAWRLAVEGEVLLGGTSDTVSADLPGGGTATSTTKVKQSVGVAGRYGYVINSSAFLYGRVGWTRTKFDETYEDPAGFIDLSETLHGVSYGAGIEWNLMRRLNLRVEYVRTDYEKTYDGMVSTGRQAVRLGLAAYF